MRRDPADAYPQGGTVVAILCGGRSRRMGGRAKATLPLAGTTVLDCVLRSTAALELPCLLVVENSPEDIVLTAALSATGVPQARDRWPDSGPLAGLEAAFVATDAQRVLLLACDLPFLTPDFLMWLLAQAENDSAVPVDGSGRLQPLCAVFQATCRPRLLEALNARELRLQEFARSIGSRLLPPEAWGSFDPSGKLLTNLNDPADYAAAQQWFGSQSLDETASDRVEHRKNEQ